METVSIRVEKENTEKLQHFKESACCLIEHDKRKNKVVKLEVSGYAEIYLYKNYLNKAIRELALAVEDGQKIEDLEFIIQHLASLNDKLDIYYEMDGIDDLLKE